MDDLREWGGFAAEGRRCGVLGAGGAGRAVVLALADAGAAEVLVVNRTPSRAFRAAALAPGRVRVARPEELDACDLVVHATSAESEWPVDPARFGSGQLVVDLSYKPSASVLLSLAGQNGARTRNGLGVLVHQAARQVRLFTGADPPLDVMWAAVSDVPTT